MRSFLLLSAVSLVGCTLSQTDTGPDAASSSATTALVVVERSSGPGETQRGDAMIARFLRVPQGVVDDAALRSVGAWLELPNGCAPLSTPTASKTPVELVDVGALTITGPQKATALLPRTMPDPAGAVNGLFYSARTTDAFAAGERVQLRVGGSRALPDIVTVNATAPRDLTDVVLTSSAAGLDVWWDASGADPRDVVYLDVTSPNATVLRCTTSDAGHFVVPASLLVGVDEGEVAVHRVHHEPFKAAPNGGAMNATNAMTIDPGDVRFDVSRVETFTR